MYKIIEPEVAGNWGKDTIADTSVHPPLIKYLHFEFYGWLGSDILETFPCFLVSERLRKLIEESNLCGISFDNAKISYSESFLEIEYNKKVPDFIWMKIHGKEDIDDFWLTEKHQLAVSEKAFCILSKFNLVGVDIFEHK